MLCDINAAKRNFAEYFLVNFFESGSMEKQHLQVSEENPEVLCSINEAKRSFAESSFAYFSCKKSRAGDSSSSERLARPIRSETTV